jgi:Putative auto-transporter adhesin, head GIN domain
MRRVLAAAAAIAAAALLAGCDVDPDAGPVRTEERSVAAFDRIDVDGRTDLLVRRGSRQTLRLRGGERLLENVTTRVAGGTLSISRNGRNGAPLDVTITLPRLRGVDADSAGRIELVDVDSEVLELRHDGAGEFAAAGRVGVLAATLGGLGELELAGLASEQATVRVSGAGRAEVDVARELDAIVTGVGEIEYHGDPTVRSDVSGLGDVHAAR